MALRKCRECGNKISTKAKACPHCGAPQKYQFLRITAGDVGCLVIIAIVVIMFATFYGIGSNGSDKGKEERIKAAQKQKVKKTRGINPEKFGHVRKDKMLKTRYCTGKIVNVREGPNVDHEKIGQVKEGERLIVLEENKKGDWIKIRVRKGENKLVGWVKKDLTITELDRKAQLKSKKEEKAKKRREKNCAEIEKSIAKLTEAGLISKFNWQLNEAHVDPLHWHSLTFQNKEIAANVMAVYCGCKRGNDLNWVVIKDSYSGKKLAKYGSWGFKTYD